MLNNFLSKNKKRITGIIQVGANLGQETEVFLENDLQHIHLFEPLQEVFLRLENKFLEQKNIYLYNFALGNKNTEMVMNVSSTNNSSSSSLLDPDLHTKLFPEVEFDKKEKVIVRKLINFNITDSNFLLLDTQGYELEVLKGLGINIKYIDFIFSEIAREHVFKDGVLVSQLDQFLKNEGFVRYRTSWASNKPTGDAIYVRTKNKNLFYMLFISAKANFTNTKIFYFFNFFKKPKKIIYLIKKNVKKYL